MLKILVVYNHWQSECVTGGQFYEENMYQCLKEYPDIEVKRICINRSRSFIKKLLSPVLNLKYLCVCRQDNLVIFNSVEGWYFIPLVILLRLFSNTKIGIIHHHFMYLEFYGVKRIFYKTLESNFLRLSTYIITVSPYIEYLCKQKFKYKNIRLWPIPFSDTVIRDGGNRKRGALLYIGTIEPRKGLIYLVKSLIVLKNSGFQCELNIIGKIKDNDYYNQLCKIINENKLKVNFLGFVKEADKDSILSEADVFVFPSLLEGYGMVLREAMSYGLPVVCFDNSAMPYLVKNMKNGLLVENMNYDAMAKAIASIITDDKLRENLSIGSYETTKETLNQEQYKDLVFRELKMLI